MELSDRNRGRKAISGAKKPAHRPIAEHSHSRNLGPRLGQRSVRIADRHTGMDFVGQLGYLPLACKLGSRRA
jgi:hypothetical protein